MNEIKDRKKQTWKYSELKKLKEMVADGIDTSTIAQLLGRTTPSITSKLWYLFFIFGLIVMVIASTLLMLLITSL